MPRIFKDAGIVKSTSEARRLIKQGAVSLNGQKINQEEISCPDSGAIFKIGKRRFLRLS